MFPKLVVEGSVLGSVHPVFLETMGSLKALAVESALCPPCKEVLGACVCVFSKHLCPL